MASTVKVPLDRPAVPAVFIPAFDFLRAAMMLLGVVFHCALSYSWLSDSHSQWFFRDSTASLIPTAALLFLHLFRMPVFFVMAGFFAAQLWQRGARAFFQNRFRRVALPLLIGWPILFPLAVLGASFANSQLTNGGVAGHQKNPINLMAVEIWSSEKLIHLWFIYYLIIYYIIVGLLSLLPRLISMEGRKLIKVIVKPATLRLLLIQFALVTLMLAASHTNIIYTPASFIPEWKYVGLFGVFFFSGWVVFSVRDRIKEMNTQWPFTLPFGIFAGSAFVGMVMRALPASAWSQRLCLSAAICLLVHGTIGVSLRFYTSMNPVVRSLARSSYWVYLIHLPIIYFAAGLMAPVPAGWPLKLICVIAITLILSFTSYHLRGLIFQTTSTHRLRFKVN